MYKLRSLTQTVTVVVQQLQEVTRNTTHNVQMSQVDMLHINDNKSQEIFSNDLNCGEWT